MKDFIELIKDNAKNYPDRIAVIDKERKISYADFLFLVNSFSQQLKPKSKVVIDLEQGIESYALIIAILNVGGTYCPLSPDAPLERKKQIINEFSPDLIVASSKENIVRFNSIKAVTVTNLLSNTNDINVSVPYDGEDIIYVIYTSGSTGVSKGVKICRKALNKFLEWSIPTYGANENDIWGQFSFLSFDLSIVDVFTCLCSGATLYSMNNLSAKKFRPAGEIEKQKITVWHSIPSAVEFMIKNWQSKSYDFSSLRLMSFCGEPLKKHHVEFLLQKNNSVSIFNTYGPTEGTLFCTWQLLNTANYCNYFHYSMCIGKAIPGWNIQLNSIEEFEEKEVTIYGDYIGKGYLGNIADSKFKKISVDGQLVESFETGDLVKEVNGNLYFSSRKDRQVKLKGYRVELDEIDLRINEFINLPSITIVKNEMLYSFIETSNSVDDIELRNHLKTVLEEYKIPHGFYPITEIPRSQNQKIDIATLKGKIK
ncbi:D-alanine--D-alanyl carrier protein ligase [bioreactor metagenome]|uniref:D-alanine--D-alanyl carrier protein ligase n=1 Tax=bioreactor metagenome TaxID=1076179 RepID=A0A644VRZ7_9ZZZZ